METARSSAQSSHRSGRPYKLIPSLKYYDGIETQLKRSALYDIKTGTADYLLGYLKTKPVVLMEHLPLNQP